MAYRTVSGFKACLVSALVVQVKTCFNRCPWCPLILFFDILKVRPQVGV